MQEQIEKILEEIRPMLAMHLGNIEFVKFEDGIVYVRMLGTCNGCSLTQLTLRAGIEELMIERIPEIKRVEAVSEHAPH
ncbi:MAG: hypothetical protein A2934_04090 [Candidatus Sungbacteria bacterium RIFCSPLOWO2_01_FULL_47_10]|uniref:NIF system FeS cluster assembly NifU C-terminal domain-containing protein n=1 Tax=Candidatus Sungbacteria bacterium RIFCSPLOWO2_01_FULL_47_10 TaxID=1802276 RepID=A0A1G2KZR3_9BACT|nr:MAG: hypothetical protein A2934_04090 [Candidatus Sungbacteria bacterium RIFCSPLOWO2_01_FULL_47_10]